MPQWTIAAMTARLVRYADLQTCRRMQSHTDALDLDENEAFVILEAHAPGRAEEREPPGTGAGFSLGGKRQTPGSVSPPYTRDSPEVVVVHSGLWRIHFGPDREMGSIDLAPGDVISVPVHVFRGFSRQDAGKGFLWTLSGRDAAGEVMRTPAMPAGRADQAMTLAMGGRFIDTSSGSYQLKDIGLGGADETELAELNMPSIERLMECVTRADAMPSDPALPLAASDVEEAGIVIPGAMCDGFPAAPIAGWRPHGFTLRRLTLQTAGYVPMHARGEPEVLLMQRGTLQVGWGGGELMLGAGDTLSVPAGLQHAFRNTASVPAVLFVVRGTETPEIPVFASAPAAG